MSRILIDAVLNVWDQNTAYVQRLIKDIPAQKMAGRCVPGNLSAGLLPNHPAWILCHLAIYHPVLIAALTGKPCPDPKDHPFGMTSKPSLDGSIYPAKDELLASFVKGHEDVKKVLQNMDPKRLEAPPALERWRPRFANQGIWLNYLCVYHESFHLGQISTWRRVQGMAAV